MKRNVIMIVFLCIILAISGCGGTQPDDEATSESSSTSAETEASKGGAEENQPTELKNKSLLDSIDGEMPTTYVMEMTNTIDGTMSTTVKTTIMDDFSKMEMSGDMYPSAFVIIYNPEEQMTYQYSIGENFGMKFPATDDVIPNMMDTEDTSFDPVELEEIDEIYGDNFIAREDTLDGKPVIYIETKAFDASNSYMKLWYSTDFFLPLKYEVYNGDQLVVSSEVTFYDAAPDLSKEDFSPPSSINFQELNMDFPSVDE